MACNDRILAAFGRSWDFPPWTAPGWEYSERASRLMPELTEAFRHVYRTSPWVWKDPRTCLTLPLWRRVLGADATVVLVSARSRRGGARRSSDVTGSRASTPWGCGTTTSAPRWRHRSGLPVVCLQFEDLVRSPHGSVSTLWPPTSELWASTSAATPRSPRRRCRVTWCTVTRHRRSCADSRRRPSSSWRRCLDAASISRPPSWREPRWVHPLLVAYRGPWALRARAGHPLRPGSRERVGGRFGGNPTPSPRLVDGAPRRGRPRPGHAPQRHLGRHAARQCARPRHLRARRHGARAVEPQRPLREPLAHAPEQRAPDPDGPDVVVPAPGG